MNYEAWEKYREEKLAEYPCQQGKWRFDLELSHPRERLEEVPIERNPHGNILTGHTCFYKSYYEWSTIFDVWEDGEKCRFLVESGNSEPFWGERVRLFSTSQYIVDEPWGTNPPNKFAYFRGKYWRITWHQFLHDYNDLYQVMGGLILQPIRSPVLVQIAHGITRHFAIPQDWGMSSGTHPIFNTYIRRVREGLKNGF